MVGKRASAMSLCQPQMVPNELPVVTCQLEGTPLESLREQLVSAQAMAAESAAVAGAALAGKVRSHSNHIAITW